MEIDDNPPHPSSGQGGAGAFGSGRPMAQVGDMERLVADARRTVAVLPQAAERVVSPPRSRRPGTPHHSSVPGRSRGSREWYQY